ncbi:MAG: hypothetical protein ABI566_12705 [Pseudolysinimonas sp.]
MSGPLTLDDVRIIVSDADGPATSSFQSGDSVSTSGADLESEQNYWISVGGRPEQCAGIVSSPYLVSARDTGERLDDPSALIGTFTEIEEERFGLVQLYARQFDDVITASGFFGELTELVQGCPSYQLVDPDGVVTWNAVSLSVAPLSGLPAKVTGIEYVETLQDSASTTVTTTFLQRDGVIISIYGELTASSSMTQADVDAIAAAVGERLGQL